MNIDQGLFRLDFIDYHAVLGISIEADAKQVRKRYLKIARKLHPDSLRTATPEQKQQASELLSKLVNPAYEKLSHEKDSAEYGVFLRLKGQQATQQQDTILLSTESARELAGTPNVDNAYNAALKRLAEAQYESLEKVPDLIGQISELNMVYLMRKVGSGKGSQSRAAVASGDSTGQSTTEGAEAPQPAAAPSRPKRITVIESYLNRAKEFEAKKNYPRAILELREALQSHPKNAACHSQLASVYLKAGQATMAKIHCNKALDLNPNDQLASMLKQRLEKSGQKGSSKKAGGSKDSQSKGGLFGLFGGKKK
ncbi:MAG: DnaJ domain-containing protein [Leptolyngbyaceae cyanobacterium MO_188.B28]|nr:DnaJ domain-containing protein [Leptolyngbyaceae cyanobacterium MO_188.B28]